LCNQGATKSDFLNHWKNYSFTKQLLDNKLAVGAKRQLRRMVIDRVVLQQKMRMSEASTSVVTATHRDIFLALLQLATSQYSEVSLTILRKCITCFTLDFSRCEAKLKDLFRCRWTCSASRTGC
jgi:hypothetical protein